MSKINRWIKSKSGVFTIGGIIVGLLVIAGLGQLVGWWDIGGITGTAGLPAPEYPAPKDGYTCLPACAANDGKFLMIANPGTATFAGSRIVVWIAVPGQYTNFELGIFDGDSGMDNTGVINKNGGNWDDGLTEANFTLYADPLKDGSGTQVIGSWNGNSDGMPNNDWYTITLDTQAEAQAPSRHFFYRLEVTQPLEGTGGNGFKLRSNGYLSAGRELLVDSDFAIVGAFASTNDLQILYPQMTSYSNMGAPTYTGDWQFSFYVPNDQKTLTLWDGDFDDGTSLSTTPDTDDPNTQGKPEWSGPFTVDERAGGKGNPPDDYPNAILKRTPSVNYKLVDPSGAPIYINDNPSGTEEWEKFVMSTDTSVKADKTVTRIQPGFYTIHIVGLDLHNLVFFRTNFEICDPVNGCGPRVWYEGSCPRTIGYWKNNVKKIYIENKTKGIQESRESLDWALRNVALASPIFRHGINVNNPVAIDDPTPLTPEEANAILQKTNGNSMLDRALQQNLATWLNLASGKIGPTTVVQLNIPSGTFKGTMEEALLEAQNIILAGDSANMERAKDIADLINNGQLNVDPDKELTCSSYNNVVPPTNQPPEYTKMPKAPPEKTPTPEVPATEEVCVDPGTSLAEGFTILAVNPEACVGEQNGLLFHGTSRTLITGNAISNGCLRSVGTHSVEVTDGKVLYVGENFGNMELISPLPEQTPDPVPESAWHLDAPDCSDPAAHQMDGKDFKGDVLLEPGLTCISGDVTVNAHDSLVGMGVTLYFIDGGLHINGQAFVNLTAPYAAAEDIAPALPGVLIYVPGANGEGQPVQINGTSDSFFSGIIYAPGSEIEFLGTGNTVAHRTQVIGWDVRVGGTADLLIDWDGKSLPICD